MPHSAADRAYRGLMQIKKGMENENPCPGLIETAGILAIARDVVAAGLEPFAVLEPACCRPDNRNRVNFHH
jgi:hypothetical protein